MKKRGRCHLAKFSFEIMERNSKTAYKLVQDKFKEVHNQKWVKQENPPNYFDYQTGWIKGTISLTSKETGTMITGTMQNQSSFIFIFALIFVIGFVFYGPIERIGFYIITLAIIIPVYIYFSVKHRKILGTKLNDALQGTSYQQS